MNLLKALTRNLGEAVNWYRKAAEQGNAWGQCNLADMYELGKGVEQDHQEALKWYRKAADQGNAGANITWGECTDSARESQRITWKR